MQDGVYLEALSEAQRRQRLEHPDLVSDLRRVERFFVQHVTLYVAHPMS